MLVVDDDRRAASHAAQWLCGLGWHAGAVGSADEALQLLARERHAACIVDGLLPGEGARRIATSLRLTSPGTGVVLMVPDGPAAAPARRIDADGVVILPVRDADLLDAVGAAVEAGKRRAAAVGGPRSASRMMGTSPAMQQVLDLAARLADAPATLLITGESGTGKSLLAREIHRTSRRQAARFVEVACGCLSETLLESELFGHVAGAFTGATTDRDGKFLQADGGTIFLDEIATATPAMQVKLLRVLQDLRFEPVGGTETRTVDARVILATHEDLGTLVNEGRFRADLFWRVNVITIEMPPLRERTGDIPLMAARFLQAAVERGGRAVEGFTPEALAVLCQHRWPGNVRELQHAVEHAVFLGRGPAVTVGDLPAAVRSGAATGFAGRGTGADRIASGGDSPERTGLIKRSLVDPERRLILEALERANWRRDAAARALGINRTTLYKKLKRLGLNLADIPGAR